MKKQLMWSGVAAGTLVVAAVGVGIAVGVNGSGDAGVPKETIGSTTNSSSSASAAPTETGPPVPAAMADGMPVPTPGTDASTIYDSEDAVPGAYRDVGYWWIDCDSPYATQDEQWAAYGCFITGFEPNIGGILVETADGGAPSSDVDLATNLLETWLSYDTDKIDAWHSKVGELADWSVLPESGPDLGWATMYRNQHYATSWRAEVTTPGGVRVQDSWIDPEGTSHVRFSVGYLSQYSLEDADCPWGEEPTETGDNYCAISHYKGDDTWTVLLRDGAVIDLIEPVILGE